MTYDKELGIAIGGTGILVLGFLLILVFALGLDSGRTRITKSCDTFGAFKYNDIIYECEKRE
jgi:hypothetical protein